MKKFNVEFDCQTIDNVSYNHCHGDIALVRRLYVSNLGEKDIENAVLEVFSEPEFILSYAKDFEVIRAGSTVAVDPDEIKLSPVYLSALSEKSRGRIAVRLLKDKNVIAEFSKEINILGYYDWDSREPEMLAALVRPKTFAAVRLLKDAEAVLNKWKLNSEFTGYGAADKTKIRNVAAAVFTAVQNLGLNIVGERIDDGVYTFGNLSKILETKEASLKDVMLLYASALEAAGLNPLLMYDGDGGSALFSGVWLVDNCLDETVSDDVTVIKKRLVSGTNDIAVFLTDKIFKEHLSFAGAEKVSAAAFSSLGGVTAVDVKRARAGIVSPLPERVKTPRGYDILEEEDFRGAAPKSIIELRDNLKLDYKLSKNKQWERRLLDLSLRNTLLNFHPGRRSMHVFSVDINDTVKSFISENELAVSEIPQDVNAFLGDGKDEFGALAKLQPLRELAQIELKHKRLRTFEDSRGLFNKLNLMYRNDRVNQEETGAGTVYLAAGFLKWYDSFSEQPKYAPLVLYPVNLIKKTGGRNFAVRFKEDEFGFNTTLLEFLKQEFSIDIRALSEIEKDKLDIEGIFSRLKKEIIHMKNWDISDDVYLASFSFTRYVMWNDIRSNIDKMRENEIIKGLLQNRLDKSKKELALETANPDADFDAKDIMLPLSADSSQIEAVIASTAGKSFVLHGPPGTGKSQTITNIIANAIACGRRVLFVADKMAALSVVKKRLDEVGIGEFCLELHSNKINKNDVTERLLNNLRLDETAKNPEFKAKSDEIKQYRSEQNKLIAAIHKKRRLNISLYDGIIRYLENADASDSLVIEHGFYEKLNEKSFKEYEAMIERLAAAAAECGDIYKSPFKDIGLLSYGTNTHKTAVNHLKLKIEQLKYLKETASMAAGLFDNRIRKFNKERLKNLYEFTNLLLKIRSEFFINNEFELMRAEFLSKFTNVPDISYADEIAADLTDGVPRRKSKALRNAFYLLNDIRKVKLKDYETESYIKYLPKLCGLSDARGKETFLGIIDRYDVFSRVEKIYTTFERGVIIDAIFETLSTEPVVLESFKAAYESYLYTDGEFNAFFAVKNEISEGENDYFDFMIARADALLDNIDLLGGFVYFNRLVERLRAAGLSFAVDPLFGGKIKAAGIISSFRKKVYQNYVESVIKDDPLLAGFSGAVLEDSIEKLKRTLEYYERLTKEEIRRRLIKRLKGPEIEETLSLEILYMQRAAKSNMRGITLRKLFDETKNLLPYLAPCMLMSPISVAQYLEADADMFDLVIFDEASQMTTCEAVGSIARGKNIIVVGDSKQLPPTSFFIADYTDEENLEQEDLESVLEDCLALGLAEKHLNWHYRSQHQSLIAFSNAMFYGNSLLTFPSPDELESRVKFKYVDGVYERGESKQNKREAEMLIEDVVRRLKNEETRKQSIGIVTFNAAQQAFIEDNLMQAVLKNKLEAAAYESDEPIFVKNLENVQGDERDVILFSVGYGPDKRGKLTLNFGPINQTNGWRRLNVAVTRARSEMVVYGSMTSGMIDLSKTNSKGVAHLKAFLEYADKGRAIIAANDKINLSDEKGIGYFIAKDLAKLGYDCKYNVGVSGFRIDAAVVDPRNKKRFILAVMSDGETARASRTARDRNVLQQYVLKRLGWNVTRVWSLNYLANPKRELKKIKELIEKLTQKTAFDDKRIIAKITKNYKTASLKNETADTEFFLNESNSKAVLAKINAVVAAEEPVALKTVVKRVLNSYSLPQRGGTKAAKAVEDLTRAGGFIIEKYADVEFVRKSPLKFNLFRNNESERAPSEIPVSEYVSVIVLAVEDALSIYRADLIDLTASLMGVGKRSQEFITAVNFAIDYADENGLILVNNNGKIILN
ncbi:MAG: DUF4011 domain-containing protein [Clostridiales bacterium]|jgi:superfamily I DNA and/or RNA helicase|nr:DUF4011 domain-containing protein [Clostridiales bacterium]